MNTDDLASQFEAHEIEALIRTAAELYNEYDDGNDILSEKQRELADRARSLMDEAAQQENAPPLPDNHEVTLTWQTTAVEEHEHTFTLGELREMYAAEGYEDYDVLDNLGALCNILADYDNASAPLISFERDQIEVKE